MQTSHLKNMENMTNNHSIDTNLDFNSEEQQKVSAVVTLIEDAAPSDASVFFKLDKVEDKYVGSVSIRSHFLQVDLAEEDFDMENLLDILNTECKEQIKEWKKNRQL